ncbi:MAG: NAD-binding protein [Chitinophagales bacterium]
MTIYRILWKNALVYLMLFVVLLVAGTIGYMSLEGFSFLEALYMTTITLASVGFSETKPLNNTGRIFTIILILANLGILTYVITKISRFLFDGEFIKLYKQLSMEKKIELLENHVIVCGCGQNGSEAIKELRKSHLQFVAIDKNEPAYISELSYFILDDATQDEVLLRAGIMKAKAILITLPNDAENMFVALTAKELNPAVTIISRASKDSSVRKLKAAGAHNVIMPDKLGGVHMASLVLFPDVKEFIDVMSTYQNNGNKITELTPTKLQTLHQLNAWQMCGATILGIKQQNGEYLVNPSGDYLIELSDRIIAIGKREQINSLKKII